MNLENKKQLAIILMAVALGLVAALLMSNHIQTSIQEESKRQSEEFKQKYMAKVQQDMEAVRQEVKRLEQEQKGLKISGASSEKIQQIAAQERRAESKSSLALRTPGGKRAYTIMIDSLSAVGGMVNPGDFVDIVGHLDIPDAGSGKTKQISSVVFQNVQILAVGTNLQAPSGGYEEQQRSRSLKLTFALTPEEASLLSFMEKHGKMQLLLRAPDETEVEVLETASWTGLADYMFEKQGTELVIPRTRAIIEPVATQKQEEVKPFIQIFQGGSLR